MILLSHSSGNTKNSGFTIVELVVVILIVGILSVSVGPRFFGKVSFDNRKTANELLAALRYSQQLAMNRGGNIKLSLTPKTSNLNAYFTVELRSSSGTITEWLPVRHPSGIKGTKDAKVNRDEVKACNALYGAIYTSYPDYEDYCHLKLFSDGLNAIAASVLYNGLGQPINISAVPLSSDIQLNVGSSTITIEADTGYAHEI